MATRKISDGVGKKIVEALKKQSEIEIIPVAEEEEEQGIESLESFVTETESAQEDFQSEDFLNNLPSDYDLGKLASGEKTSFASEEPASFLDEVPIGTTQPSFANAPQQSFTSNESFIKELDTFEIPSNIAVLKKLIAQLPSGVTRHTGAQIIKQTMEALGISMKSVLQEAQQVQEGLSNSAKECHSTIQEYKKQIISLEKQAQNNQRQYAALNELISLFIQTGV